MKKCILFLALFAGIMTVAAENICTLTLTTMPKMHCESCEKTIKDGVKFEKGVKDIKTSVKDQTVTIKYDADKTNAEKLMSAINDCGYRVSVVGGEGNGACHVDSCDDSAACNHSQNNACSKEASTQCHAPAQKHCCH